MLKDTTRRVAATALFVAAAALPATSVTAQEMYRWGSGSLGSAAQVLITGIVEVVNKTMPGFILSNEVTAGTGENLALLQSGELTIAQATSQESYQAAKSEGAWDIPDLQFLFTLYEVPVLLVVQEESDIQSMEDLVGKRVSLGPPSAGIGNFMTAVLQDGYGIFDQVNTVRLSYDDGVEGVRNGLVDASVVYTSGPVLVPFLEQIDVSADVRYIPISQEAWSKVRAAHPYYDLDMAVIPEALLQNLDVDTPTGAFFSAEFARSTLSEEAGYNLVKAIYENVSEIERYSALAAALQIETALAGATPSIAIHPGAARYYQERGVWRDGLTIGTVQ